MPAIAAVKKFGTNSNNKQCQYAGVVPVAGIVPAFRLAHADTMEEQLMYQMPVRTRRISHHTTQHTRPHTKQQPTTTPKLALLLSLRTAKCFHSRVTGAWPVTTGLIVRVIMSEQQQHNKPNLPSPGLFYRKPPFSIPSFRPHDYWPHDESLHHHMPQLFTLHGAMTCDTRNGGHADCIVVIVRAPCNA